MNQRVGVWIASIAVTVGVVAVGTVVYVHATKADANTIGSVVDGPTAAPNLNGRYTYQRLTDPGRTVVTDSNGTVIARLTDGARTVDLTGPLRTFKEPKNTDREVRTTAWVRLLPQAWSEGAETQAWFVSWLTKELADRSPDIFAIAMQYVDGAPALKDANGLRYAGDAGFGPEDEGAPNGRDERNDFLDYLGITWTFPDRGLVDPKPDRYGYLDCSGYLRTVFGYRSGYPLRDENTPGVGLPRRAWAMSKYGPGIVIIPDEQKQVDPDALPDLQPGDLVFFNTEASPIGHTDHSGIYMGRDDAGHYRFISSRAKANGPTMGDYGGAAILDGDGHFALTFRTARRL